MKLEIENIQIARVINFLDRLSLKGLKSIHRTNLSRKLQEKLKVVADNEKQIIEELKDDKEKMKEELQKFYKEKVVIDGGDSQAMLQSVKEVIKEIIKNEEQEFSNDDAYAIACLYEAFNLGNEE
jgi:tRNA isopentenyl-2-thiomethyl-A-37 hydroxylase MiaE